MKKDQDNFNNKTIHSIWTRTAVSIGFFWLLAWLTYPGDFKMEYPISEFSSYHTYYGQENPISSLFFSLSMGVLFAGMFQLVIFFNRNNKKISKFFCAIASMGCILACFPNDTYKITHSIGTAMWVFSIVFLISGYIYKNKNIFHNYKSLLGLFLGTALTYAILFALKLKPFDKYLQKSFFFVALGLSLSLPYIYKKRQHLFK